MLNKYLLIALIGIGMLSLVSPYTAPTYDDVNFTLCLDYTPPTYDSINFTLGTSDACITDTCTCAGLNQNWEINMSDYCVIIDDCNLGTGTLSFTGIGNCTINAVIDTTDLGDPGSNATLWINSEGIININ